MENITGVMKKVTDGISKEVLSRLIGEDLLEGISSKCSTENELIHACADIYVNCHPFSSWEKFATQLYSKEQTAAVEAVRSYLSPRGRCTLVVMVVYMIHRQRCILYLIPGVLQS